MDAARASPCGSPCNGLRSRGLQPTCKFRSGEGSNPETGTPAGAPIPLDQSNLVHILFIFGWIHEDYYENIWTYYHILDSSA
uniref:Uncharacterized protein n=1 Tax=Brassica oleracea var. oleracea TaxID=109376 RepID=A0A0D3B4X1_BRAOL